MLGRIDGGELQLGQGVAAERIDPPQPFDLVTEELDPQALLGVRRQHLDHVAPAAEPGADQHRVVARVLQPDQPAHQPARIHLRSHRQFQPQVAVVVGAAQPVDARHRGYHHYVAPLHQSGRGTEPQPLDLVVDRGILLNVEIAARHVRFRLVVVVVGHEIFHRVARQKVRELAVELGGEGLVVGNDQGGHLGALDDLGHRERLTGAGYPLESLIAVAVGEAARQRGDCQPLIAGGGKR